MRRILVCFVPRNGYGVHCLADDAPTVHRIIHQKEKNHRMRQAAFMLLAATITMGAFAAIGQQSDPSTVAAAPQPVQVSAPFAQQLLIKEKAMHPEIQKLGLHAVPPGQTQNVVIANNIPEKIGKASSANDMTLVAAGEPVAVRVEEGSFFDTFVPLHDRAGQIIGFLVMEVPFSTARTQEDATKKGASIRDEVQRQVPTLETLFGPAHGR
ncbi:MAG: hypothetical protein ACR2JE_05840 [Acidobacteriaceae bacterium]